MFEQSRKVARISIALGGLISVAILGASTDKASAFPITELLKLPLGGLGRSNLPRPKPEIKLLEESIKDNNLQLCAVACKLPSARVSAPTKPSGQPSVPQSQPIAPQGQPVAPQRSSSPVLSLPPIPLRLPSL